MSKTNPLPARGGSYISDGKGGLKPAKTVKPTAAKPTEKEPSNGD